MATTYLFRDVILGGVSEACNLAAKNDYVVDELYKEGNRMYILFSKWESSGEEEIELSETDRVYDELNDLAVRLNKLESALALLIPEAVAAE